MFRKLIISMILSVSLSAAYCFSVSADEKTEINAAFDTNGRAVTVTGTAYGRTIITILPESVLPETVSQDNPPVSIKQIYSEGTFSQTLTIPQKTVSGKYCVYVSAESGSDSVIFVFINTDTANEIISRLNAKKSEKSKSGFAEIITNEATGLGINSNDELFKSYSSDIINMLYLSDFSTVSDFSALYNKYLAICALKASNTSDAFSVLEKYGTSLSINAESDITNDTRLDEADRTELYALLAKLDYAGILENGEKIDFPTILEETKALAKISTASNWTTIKAVILDSFAESFKDISSGTIYSKVSDKNEVFQAMMKLSYSTFADITANFKKAAQSVYDSENSSKKSSGSSVGGGGSSSAKSSGSTYPVVSLPDTTKTTTDSNTDTNPFSDTKSGEWYYEAVVTLSKSGVVKGFPDGEFKGNDNITRAEFTKLVCSFIPYAAENGTDSVFSDVSANDWYYEYVNDAYKKGIIEGIGEKFFPDTEIKREDAAVIVYRIMKAAGKAPLGSKYFADRKDVSDYAKTAVEGLGSTGVVSGSGNDMFLPQNMITRYEATELIYNAFVRGEE